MNSGTQLNDQIMDYLSRINEEQKRALLLVAQSFAATAEEDIYTDEFLAELHQRADAMISRNVEGASWEDVKQRAKAAIKAG